MSGLAIATLALHVRDPHEKNSWGLCPSAAVGIYCPGCGGLRAVNDLTNGDVSGALSSNVVMVALIPLAVAALLLWTVARWRGSTYRIPRRLLVPTTVGFAVTLLAFAVLRNLPVGAWLAP